MFRKIYKASGTLFSSFKSLLALLIVVWFGGYVGYFYLHSLRVVVRPITLPSSAVSAGFDTQSVTEHSLAEVEHFISSSKSTKFRRLASTKDHSGCLQPNFLLVPAMEEVDADTLDGISISTSLPDWTVPKQGISLARLALSVRESLGLGVVQLVPALRLSDSGYTLVLDVQNSAAERSARLTRQIDDLEQLEFLLTELFASALSPAFGAATLEYGDVNEFEEIRELAEVMNSGDLVQAQIDFSQMLLLGYRNLTNADILLDHFRAGEIATGLVLNEKSGWLTSATSPQLLVALNSMGLGLNAEQEILRGSNETGRGELLRVLGLEGDTEEEIISEYDSERTEISSRARQVADVNNAAEAFLLAVVLSNTGFSSDALDILRESIASPLEKNLDSIEIRISTTLVLAETLIHLGDHTLANELLGDRSSILEEYPKAVDPYFENALKGATGVTKLLLGDTSELARFLKFVDVSESPCQIMSVAHSASLIVHGDPAPLSALPKQDRQRLIEQIEVVYNRIEALGLKNFAFFNNFGTFLAGHGRHDEAITKYHEALLYPGDHAWAYLNLGNALFSQGRFEEAALAFDQSLKISIIANAVFGRINSLANSGEIEQLFSEFRVYADIYNDLNDVEVRGALSSLAKLACQNEIRLPSDYFNAFRMTSVEMERIFECR